jgi:hypothetical protein
MVRRKNSGAATRATTDLHFMILPERKFRNFSQDFSKLSCKL